MKRSVIFMLLAILAGCSRPSVPARLDPAQLDGSNALVEVQALVQGGPRVAGTGGATRAAKHIAQRLQHYGVESQIDAFQETVGSDSVAFNNVQGTLPGAGEGWVVLGAHYDLKGGLDPAFEGANDSGSGVGLLLELARVLRQCPRLPFSVLLAFFDGEECRYAYGPHDGLHGSRRLAAQLVSDRRAARVKAVIVLDMIGDRNLSVTVPRNGSPDLMPRVFQAAVREGVRTQFSLYSSAILDDHQPFLDAGMPAVDLIDFEYGSEPGRNDYWHTSADRLDKLDARSLGIVGRVVLSLLNDVADADRKAHL